MKKLIPLVLALLSTSLDAATVKLAWNHPNDNSVTGYIVRYGPASNLKLTEVAFGYTNLVTLTNVPDNITVYLDVQSYNATGLRSDPSNEINFSTVKPQAPLVVRTTNTIVISVTITP